MGRVAAVLLAALVSACGATTSPPERIVLIVVDTLRRDHLGAYGAAAPTPHIDALAARGQVFSNAFASFHQTSMSMGALFTGRTPSIEFEAGRPLFWNSQTWCGMNRFAKPEDEVCMPDDLPTLAGAMREAGYRTIGVASNQFLYEPGGYARGFDDWVEVGDHPEGSDVLQRMELKRPERSRRWRRVNAGVTQALNRRDTDRFFLYVHYMDVHDYVQREIPYAEAVAAVDEGVGSLLAKLEEAGLLQGAVVILTSDHGERLDERHALPGRLGHIGNPTFLEHLRIPLIVAPAVAGDPTRFVRSEDLHRLVRELAGQPTPAERDLRDDELFVGESMFRTWLDGRWKASIRRDDDALFLFDLEADPGEVRDVAAEHPEVVARVRARVVELSEQLSARRAVAERLSPEDRERLRALGYLEDVESD